MKRSILALLLAAAAFFTAACSSAQPGTGESLVGTESVTPTSGVQTEIPPISLETTVKSIDADGNVILSVTSGELLEAGFAAWDLVTARSNGSTKSYEIPVCLSEEDVSFGGKCCRISLDAAEEKNNAVLGVNGGDFAMESRWSIDPADPGATVVTLTVKTPGGYYDTWIKRSLKRTNVREDYAELSDEDYANFRAVETTGIGKNKLYRSTSPVNPSYNRSKEADAAARGAGIATVINLTDAPGNASVYAGYKDTYYSTVEKVFCRSFVMDFLSEEFRGDLADALRFMISADAPYLIHCMEGKDRTGFVCALLEAFMGATAEEIVGDYMRSYENFYGVERGSERYEAIASANIRKTLPAALGIDSLYASDRREAAKRYLLDIGLTEEEIGLLRQKLA